MLTDFQSELEFCVNGLNDKGYLFAPINFLEPSCIQKLYPQHFASVNIKTPNEYQQLKRRLRSLPKMIWDIKQLLKEGMRQKITYALESLTGVDDQLKNLDVKVTDACFFQNISKLKGIAQVDESVFYQPFQNISNELTNTLGSKRKGEQKMVRKVINAFKMLRRFLNGQYM